MSLDLRTLLVVNPRAGGGTLGRRWESIAATLTRGLGPFHHHFTRSRGDATELARRSIADGFELIVAVGGDGTINEVLNGFFDASGKPNTKAALGVLHFGTGGDFCRTANFSRKLREGASALAGNACRPLDVGRVDYADHEGRSVTRFFANIASFGLSGLVDQLVDQQSKALGGRIGFALATVQAMRRFRAQEVELRIDDLPPRTIEPQTVAIANGQYFGGGMRIAPTARFDDGLLDIVTIDKISRIDLLKHGPRVYRGTHLDLPFVHCRQGRRVCARPIAPDTKVLLDIDGEAAGQLPATFEVIPAAIQLKCKASFSSSDFKTDATHCDGNESEKEHGKGL